MAANDDITAQVPWRGARAKALARRGSVEEAERLAREGVAIAEGSDWPNLRGDALIDLAEVLMAAHDTSGAASAARGAIEQFERKGNTVMASRAWAFLEERASAS